jgi:hypothetical protein
MNLKVITTAISLLVLVSSSSASQSEHSPLSSKQKDIRQLLEVTGTREMAMQMTTHMVASFRESMPDIPDAIWTMYIAEMDPDELVTLCIPAYESNFSHEEIRQLLQFYQSSLGKLLLEKQPMIMQECMNAGEQWGKLLNERVSANIKEFYGQDDSAKEQALSTCIESQSGNRYLNQLLTMISHTNDKKQYRAFEAGTIDPTGKMCGLTFGMSMDEVIAIWGKPSGVSINAISHLPEQILHYSASSLHFKNNQLFELSLHNIDFPNVEILEGLTFGMSPEQVATACSNLTSETKGSRIYYHVAEGITMKPHFYSKKSENAERLITVEFSKGNVVKKESAPNGLNSITGEYEIIAFFLSNKDDEDTRIVAHELKGSTLIITKDHIAATNFQGKKLMHIGNSPTVDTASEKDFIFGYFNGDQNADFYIQPEEMDLNGTVRTATCFSCDMSDGSYIILWIE